MLCPLLRSPTKASASMASLTGTVDVFSILGRESMKLGPNHTVSIDYSRLQIEAG
jgi:hypothetical protein